jgi:lysophospholipase L1-like esterase
VRAGKAVLTAGFCLTVVWHLLLLFYGTSSFSTFVVLLATAVGGGYAVAVAPCRGPDSIRARARLRVLAVTVFATLLGVEIALRTAVARYPSYTEVTGSGRYVSPWRGAIGSAALKRWLQPGADLWLISRVPNRQQVIGGPGFSFVHRFNSLGLRGDDPPLAKPPSELRVVGLGDSFTEGVGAPEDATWLAVLGRALSACSGRVVRTLNGGASGSDPFYDYVLLEQRLLAYRPDLVILAVNGSDIDDVRVRGGMERFRPDRTVAFRDGPAWEWLYGTSYIVRHVVHDVLGYDRGLVGRSQRASVTADAIARIFEVVLRFDELARTRGFALAVVIHPLLPEVEQKQFLLAPLVERLRREAGIPVVDLDAYYLGPDGIGEGGAAEYYWPIDGHHNPRGYALFARGVARALEEAGMCRPGWRPAGPPA